MSCVIFECFHEQVERQSKQQYCICTKKVPRVKIVEENEVAGVRIGKGAIGSKGRKEQALWKLELVLEQKYVRYRARVGLSIVSNV